MVTASCRDDAVVDREVAHHDLVFHLASTVGVDLVVADPVGTIDAIIGASTTVLDACTRHHRPVLVTSTSEVYGPSTAVPFREDAPLTLGPTERLRWCYGAAKALVEVRALGLHRDADLPVSIVRLFNTAGPRQRPTFGMVLPRFAAQARRGQPLTVHGDGLQRRCFASVTDVVDGVVRAATTPAARGRVINLGSTEEVTILELAERVRAAAGSTSTIAHVSHEHARGPGFDDLPRRIPDLGRARSLLGWRPTTTLDEIIGGVLAHQAHAADQTTATAVTSGALAPADPDPAADTVDPP